MSQVIITRLKKKPKYYEYSFEKVLNYVIEAK